MRRRRQGKNELAPNHRSLCVPIVHNRLPCDGPKKKTDSIGALLNLAPLLIGIFLDRIRATWDSSPESWDRLVVVVVVAERAKRMIDQGSVNIYLRVLCIVERAALELEISPSPSLEGRRLFHQESLPRADLQVRQKQTDLQLSNTSETASAQHRQVERKKLSLSGTFDAITLR